MDKILPTFAGSPKTAFTSLKNTTNQYFGAAEEPFTLKNTPTKTALECYREDILNGCILTYNEKLDGILKDVIVPKTITEFAGESGSGKTQVCFQLCITVQLPKACGGLAGEALYINTNSNFASHRIRELTKIFLELYNTLTPITPITNEFTQDFILQHIHYIPVRGYLELIACIELLGTYLKGKQIKLIVIDSISHPMRFLDAETRSTMAARMFRDLRRLAATYNFAVVLTNNLTTRVTKGVSYTTPCFGDSFYHLVNARIVFSKRNNVFCGTVVKSVLHDKKDRVFVI